MYKSKKNSKVGNRRRAQIFRRVDLILKNESRVNFSSAGCDKSGETKSIDKQQCESVPERIKNWAIEHRIQKRALNSLLKILISMGFKNICSDSRTLLRTPRSVPISQMGSGKFWYNGIAKCLNSIYSNVEEDTDVKLNVNIDGLPLFNSSKISFWPILGNVNGMHFCLISIDVSMQISNPSEFCFRYK